MRTPPAVTRDLRSAYLASFTAALVMTVVSAAGLLAPASVYPHEEMRLSFVPNDVVNLCISLPILLVSMMWTRRGKLVGLLFWPGALFYVLYNYVVFLFSMPLNGMYLLYLALVALSAATIVRLVTSIDGKAVRNRLDGAVPVRLAGGVLVGLGSLFLLRNIGVTANALISQTPIAPVAFATLLADFIIIPAWIVGGVLSWRRRPLGYVAGTGLLFQGSMLFIGLIMFLVLQPILTDAPFALADVIVILVMGLICFVPFALFVRGLTSRRVASHDASPAHPA